MGQGVVGEHVVPDRAVVPMHLYCAPVRHLQHLCQGTSHEPGMPRQSQVVVSAEGRIMTWPPRVNCKVQ
jgi:hypothetical protein